MMGAIVGDIIGSTREHRNERTLDFELFPAGSRWTDDSVLTCAVAEAILQKASYAQTVRAWAQKYPNAGYGRNFYDWMMNDQAGPYQSYGNGSAMRVSPVGWAFGTLEETLGEAEATAAISHDHPEGIRGARALAGALFLARTGKKKPAIREFVKHTIGYSLDLDFVVLRRTYRFDVSCQGSVPHAIAAFLQAKSFEETIRLAVSIGGDSDTIACMAGALAEAYGGGVPEPLAAQAWNRLDLRQKQVVAAFHQAFRIPGCIAKLGIPEEGKKSIP